MNEFLLKDYHWIENIVQATCDSFVDKIKRTTNAEVAVEYENLENELYLFSIYCNLLTSSIASQIQHKFLYFYSGSEFNAGNIICLPKRQKLQREGLEVCDNCERDNGMQR